MFEHQDFTREIATRRV